MLFTTPTQFAVLLLMLVIGWLFGFASHPGGKRWKQSYRDEQAARSRDVAERDGRIRELEADNARLTQQWESARPAAASAAVAATGVGTGAVAAAPAAAEPPAARRGWFDWGRGDDLTRLRGVDADLAARLRQESVTTFADLAELTDQDEIALEQRIDLPAGFIQREQLREQARLLVDGRSDDHSRAFAPR